MNAQLKSSPNSFFWGAGGETNASLPPALNFSWGTWLDWPLARSAPASTVSLVKPHKEHEIQFITKHDRINSFLDNLDFLLHGREDW